MPAKSSKQNPVEIFHNPRCSKSRATLALLEEKNIEFEIVEYLKSSPTANQLEDVLTKLGLEPQKVIRFGEKVAKELGISKKDEKSRAEWIELMVTNPVLIERPIVIKGDKAAIGRPIENIIELLG